MDMWDIPNMKDLPEELSVSKALLFEMARGTGHGFIYRDGLILNNEQHQRVQKGVSRPYGFVVKIGSKEDFRDALEKIQFKDVHGVSLTKVEE